MEASALPASVGLARPRIAISATLLRLRTDEQLVTLFRDGSEDAFRIIHDRYRTRLLAYAGQMLSASGQDSEDALQEIFVRAYYGLRANQRDLALRPWLYRIAHNRCVDVLRHHQPIPVDPADATMPDQQDPAARAEQRDALRRLIADVRRLPEQQRSALLMRELSGMSYSHVASALGVSVPAVKSLLVRARVGLAAASEARNTACAEIRDDLIVAHDRGVRASGLARRHLHECQGCREFRSDVRGVSRQLAALTPTLGPIGVIANLLGVGGGGAAAGTSMAGGSAAAAGGAAGTGAASAGLLAGGAGHIVTLLAAAVVTAGGAVEIQRTLSAPVPHRVHHRVARADKDHSVTAVTAATAGQSTAGATTPSSIASAFGVQAPAAPLTAASVGSHTATGAGSSYAAHALAHGSSSVPISQLLDPDHLLYNSNPSGVTTGNGLPATTGTTPTTGTGSTGAGTGTGTGTPTTPTGTPAGSPTGTTPSPTPAGGNPTPTGTGSPTGTTPTGTGAPATGGTTGTGSSGTGTGSTGTGTGATSTGTGSTSTGSTSTGSGSTSSDGTARTGSTGKSTSTRASGKSTSTRTSGKSTSTRTSGKSTSSRTSGKSTATRVAKTVGAGAASTGRVVSFVTSKRHVRHHGFALGTLLPR